MKQFIVWFNKNQSKLHPVEFAALVHKKFVFIHPFIDGNGRLARLLMNLALLRCDYTIALIPAVLRHEYIALLELAHTNDIPFKEFIADRIIATQMDLIRLLVESGGVNTESGGIKSRGKAKNGGVNSVEVMLLQTLETTPGLNTPAIAVALNMSLRTTQRWLKKLADNRKIEFHGASKNGGYFVINMNKNNP